MSLVTSRRPSLWLLLGLVWLADWCPIPWR
jgi:hypothetical protein